MVRPGGRYPSAFGLIDQMRIILKRLPQAEEIEDINSFPTRSTRRERGVQRK